MTDDWRESRLTYTVTHEAWYASSAVQTLPGPYEVGVHREALDRAGQGSGVHWEFVIEWHDFKHLNDSHTYTPRVAVFNDAWQAFIEVPDLFAALAQDKPKTVKDVTDILDRLGFIDTTERQRR